MKLRIGLGLANFPFSDARAFWRWIERCEDSTVDSIWQTDRLVSPVPLPVQRPLPLWIGGRSDAAIRRTARLGTGWLGGVEPPEQVAPVIAAITRESAAAGRPIDPDHYGAAFAFRFGAWEEPIVERTARLLSALARTPDPSRHV